MKLDHTHRLETSSWLASANEPGSDFPIQNLPFGIFRRRGSAEPFRGGVAIGNQIIDLKEVAQLFEGLSKQAANACGNSTLNDFIAMGPTAWRSLRHSLFAALLHDADSNVIQKLNLCLIPQVEAEHSIPTLVSNYTDFFTSIYHARNTGRLIRPNDPLTPNFQWLPIAYHGRASSVVVSGTPFNRPMGQAMSPGAKEPIFGPCQRLDFELELGVYVGQGNPLGIPIPLTQAEDHIFGVSLLNDWSARDHQFWEMAPLGPFLGKNFCTSVSPWIVTMEALAPYRVPFSRSIEEPQPLQYLDTTRNRQSGGLDIHLEVLLETSQHRAQSLAPDRLARTNFHHQYWTLAQMVTQHTVGGCNLIPGDLLGTGTISGPTPSEAGAIVELSHGGTKAVLLPSTGEERYFLEDGDNVILRGWCQKPGTARIGFGTCCGEVLPVRSS